MQPPRRESISRGQIALTTISSTGCSGVRSKDRGRCIRMRGGYRSRKSPGVVSPLIPRLLAEKANQRPLNQLWNERLEPRHRILRQRLFQIGHLVGRSLSPGRYCDAERAATLADAELGVAPAPHVVRLVAYSSGPSRQRTLRAHLLPEIEGRGGYDLQGDGAGGKVERRVRREEAGGLASPEPGTAWEGLDSQDAAHLLRGQQAARIICCPLSHEGAEREGGHERKTGSDRDTTHGSDLLRSSARWHTTMLAGFTEWVRARGASAGQPGGMALQTSLMGQSRQYANA